MHLLLWPAFCKRALFRLHVLSIRRVMVYENKKTRITSMHSRQCSMVQAIAFPFLYADP